LVERIAEQREAFGEGAAPQDRLRPARRQRVERREPLIDADRIVGRQHRDRRGEPDAAGARRDRRQHRLGRGDGEIGAVMLADAEHIDARLIRQHRLLDRVADRLGRVDGNAGRLGHVAERIEPEFRHHRSTLAVTCDLSRFGGKRNVPAAAIRL